MLKKLIPLLLILCLMLTSCITPPANTTEAATDGSNIPENNTNTDPDPDADPDSKPALDAGAVEKDPLGSIENATDKTDPVIRDDAKIFDIILGALTEGTTTVNLLSPELLPMMGLPSTTSLSAILKSDMENGKLHLTIPAPTDISSSIIDPNTPALLDLYLDGSKIGMQSEALLGFAGTYFADLSDQTKWEAFLEVLTEMLSASIPTPMDDTAAEEELPGEPSIGFDPTVIQLYIEQLKTVLASLEGYELDMEAMEKAIWSNMKPAVTAEDVKIGNQTVKCIAITYTVDIDTVCDILNDLMESVEIPSDLLAIINETLGSAMTEEELRARFRETLEQMQEEIQSKMAPTLVLKARINAFTGKMHGFNLAMDAKISTEKFDFVTGETVTVTENLNIAVDVLYTDAGREITASVKNGTDTAAAKLSFCREVNGYDVTYTAKLETEANGEKLTREILAVYNTMTGVITLTFKMTQDDITKMLILSGSAKAEGDTATLTVDTVSTEELILNLGLSIRFTKGLSSPISIPENATDISTLTPEDWDALLEQMEGGLLYEIIGSMGNQPLPDPDLIPMPYGTK